MHLLLAAWLALAAEPRPRPVALVLQADAGATYRRGDGPAQPLRDLELLRPGDRVEAGKAAVRLAILGDGHAETLPAGKRATLRDKGCDPAGVVQRQKGKLPPVQLKRLAELCGQAALGNLRANETDGPPPRVTPLRGTVALSRRPALTWPSVAGAIGYDVRLFSGTGRQRRLEWKASTERASSSYPQKQRDLPFGVTRTWEVTARFKGGKEEVVVKSQFNVAEETEVKQLARVRPLEAGDDPDGWVLAAATYEAYGALDEALALYEKIARARPEQANVQRALANYYARAGLKDKAEEARKRERKLRAEPDRK